VVNELGAYERFVPPFYASKDPAHDFRHTVRILGRL
jgi:hypothetical protein